MSHDFDVFVDATLEPSEFAREIERILGVKLEANPVPNVPELLFRYSDVHTKWFDIILHRLVNDRELDFENFRYELAIGRFNIQSGDDRVRLQQEYGHEIFDLLRKSNKYGLLMVDNLQQCVDRFEPTPTR